MPARRDDRARVQPGAALHFRLSAGGVRRPPHPRDGRDRRRRGGAAGRRRDCRPISPSGRTTTFFYLTGVEVPRAIVLIDGRSRPHDAVPAAARRADGALGRAGLVPGDDAVRLTGIEAVRAARRSSPRPSTRSARVDAVYTPHRGESLGAVTPDAVRAPRAALGRRSLGRTALARSGVRGESGRGAQVDIENLDPILDALRVDEEPRARSRRSARRRASRTGLMEAMQTARPGSTSTRSRPIADWCSRSNGAQGDRLLRARRRRQERHYPHYHGGDRRS